MSILSPMPIGECMISTEIATLSSISAALSSKQDTLADAQIYAIDSVVSARATEMVFDDGAVSAFNWVDTVGIPDIARAGLRGDTGEWIRHPVAIKFGNAVTTLGYGVFGWCASLMSVIVSESTTRIGKFAFEECSSLNNVIVPESTTFIGTGAFNHCTNLTSIVFKGKSKQQIEAMPNYPWWGIENTSAISTWNDASQELVDSKLSGYVPTSRTINSKALSSDLTLNAADVGALSSSGNVTLEAPLPFSASLTIEGAPAGGGKLVIGECGSTGDTPAQIVLGKQDGQANYGANITLYGASSGGQDGASINLVDNPNADVRPQLKSEIIIGNVKVRESIGQLQNSITNLESTVGQANAALEEIA